MRDLERLAALVIPLCLASCKGSSDPGEATPPADTPASTAAPGGEAPPPDTGTPAATGAAQRPTQPAGGTPTAKPSGAPDAGAPPDAGHPDAAASDAGSSSSSTKMKACTDKCQPVLQSCLTPTFPKDGGLPQVKDPAACQKAFDDCRAACTP